MAIVDRLRSVANGWRASALGLVALVSLATPAIGDSPSVTTLAAGEALRAERLSDAIELLEDPGGGLGIREVSSGSASSRFVPANAATANVGFSQSAWWARFTLRNAGVDDLRVYLRQGYPLIDYLELYEQQADGAWRERATGDRRAFDTRDVAHRDFLFPLAIPAGSERTFYLRYRSQGPVDISLSLFGADPLLASVSREQLAYGVYFGAVLMLLVWSGLVFLAVRDRAFLAYFAYVATFGLYMLINNGIAFQFLWPDSPRWGNTSLLVVLSVALLAALQFSIMILRARDYTPRLHRVALALQGLAVLALLAIPLFDYATLMAPLAALVLVSLVVMLALGLVSMAAGSRPARFYVIAWGAFLAGSIVFLLKSFGAVPHTFVTQNGWQVGALLEMIVLSMTLSSRMNELRHQSRSDSLTLLGNRRLFDDKLPAEFALARQTAQPLSLLVLDIDHFKKYNDRHGHLQGDEAIKVVAGVLRKHARKPYISCRYGGEEFCVILPGTSAQAGAMLAERLRAAVQTAIGGELGITISIGHACMSADEFASHEQLFEAADAALYAAKESGRNRVMAHRPRGDEAAAPDRSAPIARSGAESA